MTGGAGAVAAAVAAAVGMEGRLCRAGAGLGAATDITERCVVLMDRLNCVDSLCIGYTGFQIFPGARHYWAKFSVCKIEMHEKTTGSKAEVFHGTAKHTSGGLTKKDLMKTKAGRIVSRKKHAAGKKAIARLFKLGFKPTKGRFSLFGKGATRKAGRKGRATRRARKD